MAIPVLAAGHGMTARLQISHWILVFALAALPFAATYALYYPDERHYTDGGLMMLKQGNWLVPHTATGAPRFEKPPLTYWLVAASYAMFGTGVLTSRLPFLLASCGTLWLTYRLTKRLTGKTEIALLAAVILLSHPQFFLCSIRSIPDALLVFFITLSAYGFLRLIALEEFTAGAFWMAYVGAAGAALSKGLPGAGIVLFAWAFAFWQKRDWGAVKRIIHGPSLALTVVLVAGWFGYIFWYRGARALNAFLVDQVTGNIHGHWWSPMERVLLFALVLIFNFLPWSATVVEWLVRKRGKMTGNVPPPARNFLLACVALMIASFAFGEVISLRYLLPGAPLLAVLLADCLQSAEGEPLFFSLPRILKVVLVVLALAVAIAFFIDLQWPSAAVLFALPCGLFLLGIAILGSGARRRKSLLAPEALGLAILIGWLIFLTAAAPILLPDRAQQITETLRQTQTDPSRPVLLIGDVKLASRMRVLLGESWTVVQTNTLAPVAAIDYTRVLVAENKAGEFIGHGWTVQTAAVSFEVPPRGELWEALKSKRLRETLARHAQKICLATHE